MGEESCSQTLSLSQTPSFTPKIQLGKSCQATPLGLVVSDTISEQEFWKIGEAIAKVEGTVNWWLGDWLNASERLNYGDLKAIANSLDKKYTTLRQIKWISSVFSEMSTRVDILSWKHHELVASLPTEQRQYWLALASQNRWSVGRLRKEIQGSKYLSWLRFTDVWNFSDCDDRFGIPYPGRIPGQIIQNLLFYYTEEDDLVIDPMAGGGTTLDVCKHMNRKCLAFDIKPCRKDIIESDAAKSWPTIDVARLIFIDPPYSSQLADDYGGMAQLPYDEFLEEMKTVFLQSFFCSDEQTILAVLISPMAIKTEYRDTPYDFVRICNEVGLSLIRRVSVPVSSQQVKPHEVAKCKENKVFIALIRDLLLFQKTKA